ncbi:hypothetical protein ADIAL_1145 [Alkalibacterium sp. AK22]|uniref:hypothetical protein n=1 Tax=Alkalibacterium sp. AK22 TaxID=1229520 RepID=UPI00044C41E1|nr:hypothetical protein [Alkalibacterium sp. AK22]EXJ23387.1 hypothetical protein ADIAL_1145 [Alkalibacterium sp. AK22]
MAITILAKEIPGSFVRYNIKLNGSHFMKLSLGEEKELHFSEPTAEIQIRQLFGKSNKLTVSDGDCIDIRLSQWHILRMISYLLFTYILLFYNLVSISAYFVLSTVFLVVLFGYFETYELIKTEPSARRYSK